MLRMYGIRMPLWTRIAEACRGLTIDGDLHWYIFHLYLTWARSKLPPVTSHNTAGWLWMRQHRRIDSLGSFFDVSIEGLWIHGDTRSALSAYQLMGVETLTWTAYARMYSGPFLFEPVPYLKSTCAMGTTKDEVRPYSIYIPGWRYRCSRWQKDSLSCSSLSCVFSHFHRFVNLQYEYVNLNLTVIIRPIRVAKWRPSKRELVAWKEKPGPHTRIQNLSLKPG